MQREDNQVDVRFFGHQHQRWASGYIRNMHNIEFKRVNIRLKLHSKLNKIIDSELQLGDISNIHNIFAMIKEKSITGSKNILSSTTI